MPAPSHLRWYPCQLQASCRSLLLSPEGRKQLPATYWACTCSCLAEHRAAVFEKLLYSSNGWHLSCFPTPQALSYLLEMEPTTELIHLKKSYYYSHFAKGKLRHEEEISPRLHRQKTGCLSQDLNPAAGHLAAWSLPTGSPNLPRWSLYLTLDPSRPNTQPHLARVHS